jgi:hypothetical protein
MTTTADHACFADYDTATLGAVVEQARLQLAGHAPAWDAAPITVQAIHATGTAELHERARQCYLASGVAYTRDSARGRARDTPTRALHAWITSRSVLTTPDGYLRAVALDELHERATATQDTTR